MWNTMLAITGPATYMKTAGLAPRTSSLTAQLTIAGAGIPPTCSSRPMRKYSPCSQACSDCLNGSGIETTWVSGRTSGMPIGLGERIGDGPLGQSGRLGEDLADRVGVRIAVLGAVEHLLQLEQLEEVELEVPDVALVMPHRGAPPNRG